MAYTEPCLQPSTKDWIENWGRLIEFRNDWEMSTMNREMDAAVPEDTSGSWFCYVNTIVLQCFVLNDVPTFGEDHFNQI